MKVAICIPAYGDTKALFTYSLVSMVTWTLTQPITYNGRRVVPEITTHMVTAVAGPGKARQVIASRVMEAGRPDYLLWLDIDHTFPVDTFVRLAAHDLPFVGCNQRKRSGIAEIIPSAHKLVEGATVPVDPKPDGLEIVDLLGLAVCLIKGEVFETLPSPWFVDSPRGEDLLFCELAKQHGIPPIVDHALSNEVGHIAQTVLKF